MLRKTMTILILLAAASGAAWAQLSPAWMIPAAAHVNGVGDSFWTTDVAIHNPHQFQLPVVVQFLASNRENFSVPTLELTLDPWETVNLWDVLGPDLFAWNGTGALLVYADVDVLDCSVPEECYLLTTSRTYTLDPFTWAGEYAQAMPGVPVSQGLDASTLGYVSGIMNDGDEFRANAGVASWTPEWTTVQMDVQDSRGNILRTEVFQVPPFGHIQRRIATPVTGGTVVFYLVDPPADALVFPYATIVNNVTNDPTFLPTFVSVVGVSVQELKRGGFSLPQTPEVQGVPRQLERSLLEQLKRRPNPRQEVSPE